MKTAITATGPTLDADIDPRFGRCAYFLIVDTDTLNVEALENSNVALSQGAGIQSAQLLAGNGVEVVLTGNCGRKAYEALSAADIGLVLGCSGVARDAVDGLKAGSLKPASESNVNGGADMADTSAPAQEQPAPYPQTPLPGGGRGMGRGCGGGGGRRSGRGMGRGMGPGRGQGRGCGGGGQGRGRGGGMQ